MDIFTLFGMLGGIALILGAITMKTSLLNFMDVTSIMIVIGGTTASTFISFSGKSIMIAIKDMITVFFQHKVVYSQTIDDIVNIAQVARKDGNVGVEKLKVSNKLMQRGIDLIASDVNPKAIAKTLTIEKQSQQDREFESQTIIEKMGDLSPAWGMVGTLIGLVVMMLNLSDPSAIGPSMAVALLTTFYGAVLANLVFLPAATKIEQRSTKSLLEQDLVIEGIVSISQNENPRMIKDKLMGFLTGNAPTNGKKDGKKGAAKKK